MIHAQIINDTCTNNKRYMNDILSSETFNLFLYENANIQIIYDINKTL